MDGRTRNVPFREGEIFYLSVFECKLMAQEKPLRVVLIM